MNILPNWLNSQALDGLYQAHPAWCVLVFCGVHLLCSIFSFPGSCTALNIAAGAVFGFWLGCAVVYPITMLSACLVYRFGRRWNWRHFSGFVDWRKRLGSWDSLLLISLRLSPLLPFGPLNALLGSVGVPFLLFFTTTLLGIFFDVTLLNSVGAGLHAGGIHERALLITFALLLTTFVGLQMLFREKRRVFT